MKAMDQQPLTISQLAKHVGVTVRAVRHYHELGLLSEPTRDGSGYRRYGADAVIRLTRIKILAEAGVPLSQIETLTQASAKTFATAITDIKADITKRIADLQKTKRHLDALQAGDRLFVSEAVANCLAYMRRIGLSETLVAHERDAWIMISALYPAHVDAWAAQKMAILTQPDIAKLYRQLDEARTWPATDPRLRTLAADIIRMSEQESAPPLPGEAELTANTQALSLINDYGGNAFPTWKQLEKILKELTAS